MASFLMLGINGKTFTEARYSGVGAKSLCDCSSSPCNITGIKRVILQYDEHKIEETCRMAAAMPQLAAVVVV